MKLKKQLKFNLFRTSNTITMEDTKSHTSNIRSITMKTTTRITTMTIRRTTIVITSTMETITTTTMETIRRNTTITTINNNLKCHQCLFLQCQHHLFHQRLNSRQWRYVSKERYAHCCFK
jgi:hypothetical protein